MKDARRHAPAVARNRGPILEVLARLLAKPGVVLEVASGTGEHAAYFAEALPHLIWQPSERDPDAIASIVAWCHGLPNVRPPLRLDVAQTPWPRGAVSTVGTIDAIFSANLIHIAPWDACLGLLRGAACHLAPGGLLVLYGPFAIGGEHTAPSNAAFDADLRARNPAWGVRDLEAVVAAARDCGLALRERIAMAANNQTVVFECSRATQPRAPAARSPHRPRR